MNRGNDLRSDLACERRRADLSCDEVKYERCFSSVGSWERIRITGREGETCIGRPRGSYDTLTIGRADLLSSEEISDAAEEIASELCRLMEGLAVSPDRLLIAGLGNRELTPDSLGPRTAEMVNATMHLRRLDEKSFFAMDCSEIAVIKPGVSAESGMESAELLASLCGIIKPDAVIAVDSLAARSPQRLGRTLQLSDTGIFPGSGIGNHRAELTKKTVGAPVIAIGVPTVIDARLLAGDSAFSQSEEMFVSPKEIDAIVRASAQIIAEGINQAFGICF